MMFQIPQNLDIEDSIIFGLSFKQIGYLGGSIGFFIFLIFITNFIVATIIGAPIVAFGAALAFFKYNNKSFLSLFYSFIRFSTRNKLYLYTKNSSKYEKRYVKTLQEKGERKIDSNDISEISTSLLFEEEADI